MTHGEVHPSGKRDFREKVGVYSRRVRRYSRQPPCVRAVSYILFFVRRSATTSMSRAENQVTLPSARRGWESVPRVRIKTIYRNYRRARFIEFDRITVFLRVASLFLFFFPLLRSVGGGNARNAHCNMRKTLDIRTCVSTTVQSRHARRGRISLSPFYFILFFFKSLRCDPMSG